MDVPNNIIDNVIRAFGNFALAVTQNNPAVLSQGPVISAIAPTIVHNFVIPEIGIGLWSAVVTIAAMPETTVHEHGYAR